MINRKTHFAFLVFLIVIFFNHAAVQAATLHAIVVCDTHADEIEDSVEADYRNIRKEIKRISKYTKLKARIKRFTGKKVDSDFLDTVKKLKVKSDDVVLFYWSGHGMRFESQEDPWPVFDFEHDSQVVSQNTVTEELMSKNPRLLLSITDCCNDYAAKSALVTYKRDKQISKENYHTLFLDSSGTYIATAASPGEVSFGLNGNSSDMDLPAGGFFTNALLESLYEETSQTNPDISWEMVFEIAVNKTLEYQLRDEYDPYIYHYPHYQYIAN